MYIHHQARRSLPRVSRSGTLYEQTFTIVSGGVDNLANKDRGTGASAEVQKQV